MYVTIHQIYQIHQLISNICICPTLILQWTKPLSVTPPGWSSDRTSPSSRHACMSAVEQSKLTLAFCSQGDSGIIGLTGAPGQKGEKVWHWTWTRGGLLFCDIMITHLKRSHIGGNCVFPIIQQGLGGVPGIDGLPGDKGDKVRHAVHCGFPV